MIAAARRNRGGRGRSYCVGEDGDERCPGCNGSLEPHRSFQQLLSRLWPSLNRIALGSIRQQQDPPPPLSPTRFLRPVIRHHPRRRLVPPPQATPARLKRHRWFLLRRVTPSRPQQHPHPQHPLHPRRPPASDLLDRRSSARQAPAPSSQSGKRRRFEPESRPKLG